MCLLLFKISCEDLRFANILLVFFFRCEDFHTDRSSNICGNSSAVITLSTSNSVSSNFLSACKSNSSWWSTRLIVHHIFLLLQIPNYHCIILVMYLIYLFSYFIFTIFYITVNHVIILNIFYVFLSKINFISLWLIKTRKSTVKPTRE